MKSFIFACLPFSQPSFLTAHQKQEPATAVSIPVSASTHFRAISDTGPSSLTICVPQPGETAAHGVDNDTKEIKNGDRVGLTTMTGDRAGGEQGSFCGHIAFNGQIVVYVTGLKPERPVTCVVPCQSINRYKCLICFTKHFQIFKQIYSIFLK